MLTQAMEISGLEGNFRITCESVMRVLRQNRSSVMALLEAFVYDPLVNWRLNALKGKRAAGFASKKTAQADESRMSGSYGILASLSESGASPGTQPQHTTLVVLVQAGVLTLSSGGRRDVRVVDSQPAQAPIHGLRRR